MAEIETRDKPHNVEELQDVLSAYQLNAKNYLKRSQLIKAILKGKERLAIWMMMLLLKMILLSSPGMKKTMIMVWLWNLVVPEISDTCMFFNLAS